MSTENTENTTPDTPSTHSETTHEELLKELTMIQMVHQITGKIDAETLSMLLQTALLADILVREKEKAKETDAKVNTDLQAESFLKDIEIASLRAQLEDRAL